MKNNLATDVYEHLMKKIRVLWALLMACILLMAATNCAWANAYFRCMEEHAEYLGAQGKIEVIIPEASPDGKRMRGT